jgi:hypothetical protein
MLALADRDTAATDLQQEDAIAPEVAPEVEAEAEAAAEAQPQAAAPVTADPAVAAADPAAAMADPALAVGDPVTAAATAADPQAAIPEIAAAKDAGQAAPAKDATASEQAYGTTALDRGMYQPADYLAACRAAGAEQRWDARYVNGHTAALGWTQPYETHNRNSFTLKAGHSASQALKDFIAGPTIGDFRVLAVALEIDGVRDTLGDQKFDRLFGSADGNIDAQIKASQRLLIDIDIYTTPFADRMLAYAVEQDEAIRHAETVPEPVVAAKLEEKPRDKTDEQPAPEMIADELGIERERELA